MDKRAMIAAALAAACAASSAQAQMGGGADKEKCYGVAKSGQNDCGSSDGAHGCAHGGFEGRRGVGLVWLARRQGHRLRR